MPGTHPCLLRRRRPAGSIPALCLLTVLISDRAVATPPAPSGSQSARQEYAELLASSLELERERTVKKRLLEVAQDDSPYLVIDLESRELRIVVRVSPVRVIKAGSLTVEGKQGLLRPAPPEAGWSEEIFELVGKSGPRREPEKITPPDDAAGKQEVDPRSVTPEQIGLEKDPEYPGWYVLIYRQGLAVSIGGEAPPEGKPGWFRQVVDRARHRLMRPDAPPEAEVVPVKGWVRVALPEAEAKALYPSLYTGMRALVRLPGDPPF